MKKKNIQIFSKVKFSKDLAIKTMKVGIKNKFKEDVTVVTFKDYANVASVTTTSKTCAANISWLKKIKKNGKVKALFVNSGNANAYTGKVGYENVIKIAKSLAKINNCEKENIIISSTGVIGEQLPIDSIIKKLLQSIRKETLEQQNWLSFAKAIMTTDTFPKIAYKQTLINKKKYNIVGISKGSGMIAPNMATMLGFIFTDAQITTKQLQELLKTSVEKSFNSISVDGDASTNDMVSLFSVKNKSKTKVLNEKDLKSFQKDLDDVAIKLAKQIVIDGEGARKIIEIRVKGAINNIQAKYVAFSVANSLLVKTAIAGEDANWGRIIMAIGNSSAKVNQKKISIKIGDYIIIKEGEKSKNYEEVEVSKYLKNKEIIISINLFLGKGFNKVWTCDLTKKYIEINADYRS